MNPSRPQNPPMRRSKTELGCKKHPKHRQSPGVCSVCLKERLSQLSMTSSLSRATTFAGSCSSSSSLSSLSSEYSSSDTSPRHRHYGGETKGSFSLLMKSSKNVLTKSRSVAFVARMGGDGKDGKKKGGFWSKLLRRPRSTMRVDEGLLQYSRTVRENMTIKVY